MVAGPPRASARALGFILRTKGMAAVIPPIRPKTLVAMRNTRRRSGLLSSIARTQTYLKPPGCE